MKLLFANAALAALILTAGSSLAGNIPNYNCADKNEQCVRRCDDAADTGKNANAYQVCLNKCERANRLCTKRQDSVDRCGPAFKSCYRNAHSEADKERCRAAYRRCKGTD